jgi:predicted amidophosphoribosyltransferase
MQLPDSYIRQRIPSAGDFPEWHVWVLGPHSSEDGSTRTYLGEQVTRAKYHGDEQAMEELRVVTRQSVRQLRQFGPEKQGLFGVDAVVAVPFLSGKRTTDKSLPHQLAVVVSDELDVPLRSDDVARVLGDGEAKLGTTVNDSWFHLEGRFAGMRVLIVDDLLRTGGTLSAVGRILNRGGARSLVGLCMTKAYKGYVAR